MARRRGDGEGSIYRRKDGRWAGTVQVGVTEYGGRQRRTVYGRTRAHVLEQLDELRRQAARGAVPEPGRLTVGDYLKRWVDDVAASRVRLGTLDVYRRALAPVRERLGGLRLRALSPLHVQSMLRALEEEGKPGRARQMTYTYLRTALRDAVRMRLLVSNPCEGVDRPRAVRPEVAHLAREEVARLLEAAKGDRLEALYVLAVASGLRLGELLGLRWRDVSLRAGEVTVRRTLIENVTTGQRTLEEPKTARSRRTVGLPAFAVAALRRHRDALGAAPHPDRLVFADRLGQPIRRSNLHRRSYKPLLERAKLPRVSFHALRHTHATLALEAGVHPRIVQERLGHASIELTLGTYSHAVPRLDRDAAERLDTLLGEGPK
jgi:integrase